MVHIYPANTHSFVKPIFLVLFFLISIPPLAYSIEPYTCDLQDGGEIEGDELKCGPYSPLSIRHIREAEGAGEDIVYQWQYSSVSTEGPWIDIDTAVEKEYTPDVISKTTWFRRLAFQTGCEEGIASNVIVKKVGNKPLASFDIPSQICAGDTVDFNISSPQNTALYFWSFTAAVFDADSGQTASSSWTEPGSYLATVQAVDGICSTQTTRNIKVLDCCENVADGGEVGFDEMECGPYDPEKIINVILPSGGSGELEYLWMTSNDSSLPLEDWEVIPNSDTPEFDPEEIKFSQYYVRCARRSGCTNYIAESNFVLKAIDIIAECAASHIGFDLNVKQRNTSEIELSWTTAPYETSATFEVQKSTDRLAYERIAEIETDGSDVYTYVDKDIESPLNYYRIIQQNSGGVAYISDTERLAIRQVAKSEGIVLYPNPTQQELRLNMNLDEQTGKFVQIRILDMSGKMFYESVSTWENGKRIDISELPQGTYTLIVIRPETDSIWSDTFEKN